MVMQRRTKVNPMPLHSYICKDSHLSAAACSCSKILMWRLWLYPVVFTTCMLIQFWFIFFWFLKVCKPARMPASMLPLHGLSPSATRAKALLSSSPWNTSRRLIAGAVMSKSSLLTSIRLICTESRSTLSCLVGLVCVCFSFFQWLVNRRTKVLFFLLLFIILNRSGYLWLQHKKGPRYL